MSPRNQQQSQEQEVPTSGSYPRGGPFPLSGGFGPLGGGPGGGMPMAGNVWQSDQTAHFQLAPRLYLLSLGDASAVGNLAAPLDEIPSQLEFQQDSTIPNGALRQVWSTESASRWIWQLVVELTHNVLGGRLTAAPPSHAIGDLTLIWKSDRPWDFFGRNELRLDETVSQPLPLVLYAAAP